jgi:hypothetical protein
MWRARLMGLAFGPLNRGAKDAQDLVGPGLAGPVAFGPQPVFGGLAGGEQLLLDRRCPLNARPRRRVRQNDRMVDRVQVANVDVDRLRGILVGRRLPFRCRQLVGVVIRRRFGRRLGRKAGGPAAFVAQGGAELGGAQPAAEQAVGGVEDVLGGTGDLRGVALGVGVPALVLLRICASWARLKGYSMLIGGVLTSAPRGRRRLLPPHAPPANRAGLAAR